MEVEEDYERGKLGFDEIGAGDREQGGTSDRLVSMRVGEDWVSWAKEEAGEWVEGKLGDWAGEELEEMREGMTRGSGEIG